jgi:hypothetical protein
MAARSSTIAPVNLSATFHNIMTEISIIQLIFGIESKFRFTTLRKIQYKNHN